MVLGEPLVSDGVVFEIVIDFFEKINGSELSRTGFIESLKLNSVGDNGLRSFLFRPTD